MKNIHRNKKNIAPNPNRGRDNSRIIPTRDGQILAFSLPPQARLTGFTAYPQICGAVWVTFFCSVIYNIFAGGCAILA
jgi:hypothetical protein